jgi:hypothetical protein
MAAPADDVPRMERAAHVPRQLPSRVAGTRVLMRRQVAMTCITVVVAGSSGCGASGRSHTAATQGNTTPKARSVTNQPSRGGRTGVRVCGYMRAGSYTASVVEVVDVTCAQAAKVVRTYLLGSARVANGWRPHQSCIRRRRGAPPAGAGACSVVEVSGRRRVWFFKTGRRGRRPPGPMVHTEPGDDRDFAKGASD